MVVPTMAAFVFLVGDCISCDFPTRTCSEVDWVQAAVVHGGIACSVRVVQDAGSVFPYSIRRAEEACSALGCIPHLLHPAACTTGEHHGSIYGETGGVWGYRRRAFCLPLIRLVGAGSLGGLDTGGRWRLVSCAPISVHMPSITQGGMCVYMFGDRSRRCCIFGRDAGRG